MLNDSSFDIPEFNTISILFRAAALSEIALSDSAAKLIETIQPDTTNNRLMSWYYSLKGLIYFRNDNLKQAYNALSVANSLNPDIRARALNKRLLARIQFTTSDYTSALENLAESNRYYEQADLPKSIAVNEKILGRYFMTIKNYEQALTHFQQAEQQFKQFNDSAELFYLYINLIDYNLHTGNLEQAENYATLCFDEFSHQTDNQMKALVYNNLGEVNFRVKNYMKAIYYFRLTLELEAVTAELQNRMITAHLFLSRIYNRLNKSRDAQYYAFQARKFLHPDVPEIKKAEIYRQLAESYQAEQKFSLAYTYIDSANFSMNEALESVIATSNAFYETSVSLHKSGMEVEKLKFESQKHKQLIRTILLILIFVFLALLIIYRIQHSKNKILKELVRKNMELLDEERLHYEINSIHQHQIRLCRKPITTNKSCELYKALIEWLETGKKYTNCELTLDSVAKEMSTNREYLSRAINEQEITFPRLLSRYRVNETIRILTDPTDPKNKYNLASIAREAGFNSISVFIDAFRKQTGMTPDQFRRNLNQH
jgi:AraC-like DNA-binding protein